MGNRLSEAWTNDGILEGTSVDDHPEVRTLSCIMMLANMMLGWRTSDPWMQVLSNPGMYTYAFSRAVV